MEAHKKVHLIEIWRRSLNPSLKYTKSRHTDIAMTGVRRLSGQIKPIASNLSSGQKTQFLYPKGYRRLSMVRWETAPRKV